MISRALERAEHVACLWEAEVGNQELYTSKTIVEFEATTQKLAKVQKGTKRESVGTVLKDRVIRRAAKRWEDRRVFFPA